MAIFLTREEVNAEIVKVIKNARKEVVLISPYLKLNQALFDRLANAIKTGIRVTIIHGKTELDDVEIQKINTLNHLEVYYHEMLHGKCYFNESKAVVTSMNLHEFSMNNNIEFGILVDATEDKKIYDEISNEYVLLKNTSENRMIQENDSVRQGFCVRCRDYIELNLEKPMCTKCFRSWAEFSNPNYIERYCHVCGIENKSTIAKPVCLTCYRKII